MLRRRHIFIALVLTCLTACHTLYPTMPDNLPPPHIPAPGPHLKVVTYNLNWLNGREKKWADPEASLATMQYQPADILVLQEVTPKWADILRDNLTQYPYFIIQPNTTDPGGMAVFSYYPIVVQRVFEPKSAWYPALILDAQTPVGPVQIVNVHLRPPLYRYGGVGFLAHAVKATTQSRLVEMQDITSHISTDRPTLIVGDFNESPTGPARQWLLKSGYQSALQTAGVYAPTWYWQSPIGKVTRQYDDIYFSNDFSLEFSDVLPAGGSDHYPVVAMLREG